MKRNATVLIAVLSLAWLSAAAAESEEPKPDKDGFVPLFNGKNLDGWEVVGKAEGFTVTDGIIRSLSGSGAQWMYYKKKRFSDFVLKVEWRVSPKGNSGVFIRVPPDKPLNAPWISGYEVQISCEEPPRDDKHCTGALYNYQKVAPRPDETPEKWRTYEITCKDRQIAVKVDGVQVLSLDQNSKEETKHKPLTGWVGVQDSHGPPETWIEYRSIKIKDLTVQPETTAGN